MTTSTWYASDPQGELDRLLGEWADAPFELEETLAFLLETSKEQVINFAPEPKAGEDIENAPLTRYVGAQLQQAKNLWNAGRASGDGDVGAEGFSFTPRPLDKSIKQMIRPPDGKPHAL